jgi:hypothetical protein
MNESLIRQLAVSGSGLIVAGALFEHHVMLFDLHTGRLTRPFIYVRPITSDWKKGRRELRQPFLLKRSCLLLKDIENGRCVGRLDL